MRRHAQYKPIIRALCAKYIIPSRHHALYSILARSSQRWNFFHVFSRDHLAGGVSCIFSRDHLGFIFNSSSLDHLYTWINFRLIIEFNYPEDRISKYLGSVESKVSICFRPTEPKLSLSGAIEPELSNSFLNFQFFLQLSANFPIHFCHRAETF